MHFTSSAWSRRRRWATALLDKDTLHLDSTGFDIVGFILHSHTDLLANKLREVESGGNEVGPVGAFRPRGGNLVPLNVVRVTRGIFRGNPNRDVVVHIVEITGDVGHRHAGTRHILHGKPPRNQPVFVFIVGAVGIARHLSGAVVNLPRLGTSRIVSRISAERGGKVLIIRQVSITARHIAVKLQLTGRTQQKLPCAVVNRGDGSQITCTLRQRVVGKVSVVACAHNDSL